MQTTSIPGTQLTPSSLCMGTGDFGGAIQRETAFLLLDAFVDHGGTFLDTAKVYNDWIPGESSRSEKTIGEWMKQRSNRNKIIVGTKGAHPDLATMNIQRLSPQEIVSDLNASLTHLQTDVIDLYWLHRDDPNRSVEEILETINQQVAFGKIRAFGCSNWKVDRIEAAQEYAREHGLAGFAAVQNLWNLACINQKAIADPTIVAMDDALWQYHNQHNLAAVPFTSQANGLFQKLEAGRRANLSRNQQAVYLNDETERRFERLKALKDQTGMTTTQIVLGYLLSQPFPVIPVFSSRNLDQLSDSLQASDTRLTVEQVHFLEQG